MKNYTDLIDKLNLIPHPEGGYYRRNWQSLLSGDIKDSTQKVLFNSRSIGSSIIYLLPSSEVSAWHRISCDEMWHFYEGSPLKIYTLNAQKGYEEMTLGCDISAGQIPQIIIHRHTWYAAETLEPNSHTLCGCTLWPSFTYADFEMADIAKLKDEFSRFTAQIDHIAKRSK
jgi:predicted cupin superfamily sugar epimerase